MTDITHWRLHSQRLTGTPLETPEEVVHRLGAIQSQDFAPAKWSIAQRTSGVTDEDLDRAFAAGTLLRTHILRPTWHFVLPADIRWMLELTAPRVHRLLSSLYRSQDLNQDVLARGNAILARALEGGQHLTRKEIAGALEMAGIPVTSLRLAAIVMNAELNCVVCSGAPRGKQQTYALLEERVPQARRLSHEDALAEVALRYFTGHGPATIKDLRWWSSLTMADIERGLTMVAPGLEREVINGETYWFAASASVPAPHSPTVHLVQGYDEYIVGYGETKYVIDASGTARSLPRARGIYTHAVILDGQVAGEWKPVPKRNAISIEAVLFTPFSGAQMQTLNGAVQRYGEFLGQPAELTVSG